MEFKLERRGHSIGVAELDGRVDFMNSYSLRSQICAAVREGCTCLILDLKNVTFIDTNGIDALLAGLIGARRQGGELALVQVNSQIDRKLKLADLGRMVPVYQDVNAALARA